MASIRTLTVDLEASIRDRRKDWGAWVAIATYAAVVGFGLGVLFTKVCLR